MKITKTATGKDQIVAQENVAYAMFQKIAQDICKDLNFIIKNQIIATSEQMYIVTHNGYELCVSWDDWLEEVTIMPWGTTPDDYIVNVSFFR